jgi:hemoglobin
MTAMAPWRGWFVMLSIGLLSACVDMPVRRAPSLYAQLGGSQGIAALTDASIDHYAADPRVAPAFAHADISRFRSMFGQYLCQLADGPCVFKGDNMAEVHRGMPLGDTRFNALVEDFTAAMTSLHLPVRVQNRVLERLAAQHGQVTCQ